MRYIFLILVSIFFRTVAYCDNLPGVSSKKYTISEISEEKYNQINDKNTQLFITDIKNSGAQGKLVKISFNNELKKALGGAVSYIFEGYYFVLNQAPNVIVENSSSIFAKDFSLQREIQEYLDSGIQVVLIPLEKGVKGFVLENESEWEKDLISFMFPNGDSQILGLASSANISSAMHERQHIRQNIPGHYIYLIRQRISNLPISNEEQQIAMQFINEFDAYQKALTEIQNLDALRSKPKVWWRESMTRIQNGVSEDIDTFHEVYIPELYEIENKDAQRSLRWYAEPLSHVLNSLMKNNLSGYCSLIEQINLTPQNFLKVENYLEISMHTEPCRR